MATKSVAGKTLEEFVQVILDHARELMPEEKYDHNFMQSLWRGERVNGIFFS
jgi:hypothetical protein